MMGQEFFEKKIHLTGLVSGAALIMIAAGLIHLYIIPGHLAHAPAHGIFLALVGIAEIVWGLAFWHQPSPKLYRTGMVMASSFVTLWVITRLLPVPFGHGQEAIEIFGIVCGICEGLSIGVLSFLVVSGETQRDIRISAWRSIASLLALSLILAGLTYGVAMAAESLTKTDHYEEIDQIHENNLHEGQTLKQRSESTGIPHDMKNNMIIGRKKEIKEAVKINDLQEIDLRINASGYSPNVIIAKKGILLKIKVHSEENAGCAGEVIFPDFGVRKTVPAGSSGVIEVLPDQEGTFDFSCPMGMVRGELIISNFV